MPRKQEPVNQGEWLVTYGDTITLLVCFFVMMFAFRKVGDEAKVSDLIGSVRQGFESDRSMVIGGPQSMDPRDAVKTLKKKLKDSGAVLLSVKGVYVRATFANEGMKFQFTGAPLFEEGKSELSEDAEQSIARLGKEFLAGYKNVVEVRGFTSPGPEDTVDGSAWRLGYDRAMAVTALLTDQVRGGVVPERLRVLSAGDSEPVSLSAETGLGKEMNRRVEILVYEIFSSPFKR